MNRVISSKKVIRKLNLKNIAIVMMIAIVHFTISELIFAVNIDDNNNNILLDITANASIFVLIFIIISSIIITHDSLDYLICLGVNRKSIFKAIISVFLEINIIISIGALILIFLNINYGNTYLEKNLLLRYGTCNLNILHYGMLFAFLLAIIYLVMIYLMFIVLLGKNYDWYYLVGTILFTISIGIICINRIITFVILGDNNISIYIVVFIVDLLMTFINKKLCEKLEFNR
ncbi:MAG: hypothetical protein N4A63_16560 [Vallitalea sp.]|jgi:hypothetical protein|nr:hypothetical protein [Vallitalea sp.]